jgi:hypothetical protein
MCHLAVKVEGKFINYSINHGDIQEKKGSCRFKKGVKTTKEHRDKKYRRFYASKVSKRKLTAGNGR